MNGDQIEKILAQSLACTRTHFLGVFARDQLPTPSKYPACFVANTDPISLPGTHRVAFFYHSPTHLEFFDSYGEPPDFYNFPISKKITSLTTNSYPLQSLRTSVCGQFCVYYLFQRSRSMPMARIVSSLRSLPNPDLFVKTFVARLRSKIKRDHFSCSCSNFQTCKCKE